MSNFAALVHGAIDHMGKRTFTVWVYDTSKPRGDLSRLPSRYAAVRMLGVYSTQDAAEQAISDNGWPMLAA